MKYEIKCFEVVDGKVDLPDGAVSLEVTLMLTGQLMGAGTTVVDGISCLVPIKELNDK